ncbi:protein-glutamate O-methyltransferase CheR [Neobacillus sp. MM2021_6]|uniref:CheR family methyltransferase n=1 Tax=Bacillaceae TaxID=186817 RepID=UPI00140830B9|nr:MULTISPECIES: protein-glutamate O-methyltransferase CheR [Bacillaceae]MBO0961809.1 protein-glutamate O-methyltransferase CheR [Neobacillus sp. MM2021_6]NHC21094.1 protein-glutamate O-methyltransferase CheR [Bacillus sp. MM2020_4]
MVDTGLVKLSQMIYDYCGLHYKDRLPSLRDKISKRVVELGLSYRDYCNYLQRTPSEWEILVELLTINETYFYREESQLNECCSIILPMMKRKLRDRPLRIWSAACSTGEEPYTLAMLIQETGLFPMGTVEIIGSDINKKVIKKADQGWYHKNSFAFRRMPEHLLEKYFNVENGGYQINASIKRMVKFQELNLLNENDLPQIGEVDIIFCRNVLIYFDQDTIKRVIRNLHQNLKPNGYLFLGHAESITEMSLGFQKVDSSKTFYYRKEPNQNETLRYISG